MSPDSEAVEEAIAMKLTYYGHSAFLLEAADGTRVIVDPYRSGAFGNALRYGPVAEAADAVACSHEHDDHGAVDTVLGHPQVFVHPVDATVGPWHIRGVDAAHDAEGGRSRGKNTIMVFDDGDVTVVHLGDLGHELDAAACAAIGATDILLVPVGGFFTIDHQQAARVVEAIGPRIVVPMHYKTPKVDFPIEPVEPFLDTQASVEREPGSSLEVSADTLPAKRVSIVLRPAR
jgi:L-ascorbate metabolism protein UlaG (beta-lactamase superfamily)